MPTQTDRSFTLTLLVAHFRRLCLIVAAASLSACAVQTVPNAGPDQTTAAGSSTLRLAQATAESGDYTNAARLFEKELASNPDSVDALKGAGDAYSRMGQHGRAETVLLRAHELAPSNDDVLAILGRVYLSQKRPDEAIKYYDKALRNNRSNISAITGKGVALDTMSQHLKAQKVYQDGLSAYPTNFILRSNYALSLALTGHSAKSISILQELVRDPNAAPYVRANLALVYGLAGQENEARATLSLDMSAKEIEENIAIYRALRRSMNDGNPIGSLVFA
ncbi:tetratricopeptide repeat protein [Pseudosulfitobacter sp. DSM 107133]|jgi:Flp pilus assembly protein TadD|uniref:tetratricopeptide repeat protein n=1 Tax=Pseudosulfitobacter sp. DSM 107133 TaxID=2883100 RepID=UPI000DF4A2D4|nr:tetratricopeptide repeat protein [Pseudosulfitobacter sp. DSM 107133]UOA25406.1 Beta-barrel assembly-enhancing protease [Pseudosulfitobacter sp. DSM 107133]